MTVILLLLWITMQISVFSNGDPLRTTDLVCSWKANGLIIKSHKPQTQRVIFYCISHFFYPFIFFLLYDEEKDTQIYEKFAYLCFGKLSITLISVTRDQSTSSAYLCFGKLSITSISVTRDQSTSSSWLLFLTENSQRFNQLSNRALMDTVNSIPGFKRHRKYLKGYRCWKYMKVWQWPVI